MHYDFLKCYPPYNAVCFDEFDFHDADQNLVDELWGVTSIFFCWIVQVQIATKTVKFAWIVATNEHMKPSFAALRSLMLGPLSHKNPGKL